MSTERRRRTRRRRTISRREAELLLSGGNRGADPDALSSLLAAASARPLPHELRDRSLVVAAFVRASLEGAPQSPHPARRPLLSRLLTRALPVKLAAVLVVLLFGGVAVAARSGALPRPIQSAMHSVFSGVGVPPPANPEHPAGSEDDEDVPRTTPAPGAEPSEDDADLTQACRAYQQTQAGQDEIDPADLATLERAAGGATHIAAFCDHYLSVVSASPSTQETNPSPSATTPDEAGPDQTAAPGADGDGSG